MDLAVNQGAAETVMPLIRNKTVIYNAVITRRSVYDIIQAVTQVLSLIPGPTHADAIDISVRTTGELYEVTVWRMGNAVDTHQ